MAQEPNIEITPSDGPPHELAYSGGATRRGGRPGVIETPADVPSGEGFGTPGPDTGWALKLIRRGVEDLTLPVEKILGALMGARAAHFGRAPTPEDLDVAVLVSGLGSVTTGELDDRRRRWERTVAHEKSPGRSAVTEMGETLFGSVDSVESALTDGV